MKPKKTQCKEFKIVCNGIGPATRIYLDGKQIGLIEKIFFHAETGHNYPIVKGIKLKRAKGKVIEQPFEIVFIK